MDFGALQTQLDTLTQRQPFRAAWFIKDLARGAVLEHDGDRLVATRSTRKVAIMMTLLAAAHRGEVDLAQSIEVPEAFQHTRSGVTQHFMPRPVLRLADAMMLMICVSDNGCTGAIMELLGLERVNAFCRAAGMRDTLHRTSMPLDSDALEANTVSTPREQALLLQAVLDGSRDEAAANRLGCTSAHCDMALRALKAQLLRSKIPALLPADAVVAHKDGTGPGLHHDTGVVFRGEHPLFIVCAYTSEVPVMLEAGGESGVVAASRFIARLTRTAWDALAG